VKKYTGTVLSALANFYWVLLDDRSTYLLCTRRSRLKKSGQSVLVGDFVVLQEVDFQCWRGAISQILERRSIIDRPPIANVDQILLIFALADPFLDPWQLSRFLIKTESVGIKVHLCLNKSDLISIKESEQWQERLKNWGYQPILISLNQSLGLDKLLTALKDKITVMTGPSGVGKSSLINTLIPKATQTVAHVSGKLHRGRHTTRHVELFTIPNGGMVADTPGFNQANLEFSPIELAYLFPEIRAQLGNCQFNNCLHRDEPNCSVRGNWERYAHYLKFLEEVNSQQKIETTETAFKIKMGAEGTKLYQPKLEFKKYRQNSRRQKNQDLQKLYKQKEDSTD
jgi:ribosome biogenesis GTPase